MTTITEQWKTFEAAAVPVDAGPRQRAAMKSGFFAGAAAMLGLMCAIADTAVDEDDGAARIEQLNQELRRYIGSLAAPGQVRPS